MSKKVNYSLILTAGLIVLLIVSVGGKKLTEKKSVYFVQCDTYLYEVCASGEVEISASLEEDEKVRILYTNGNVSYVKSVKTEEEGWIENIFLSSKKNAPAIKVHTFTEITLTQALAFVKGDLEILID